MQVAVEVIWFPLSIGIWLWAINLRKFFVHMCTVSSVCVCDGVMRVRVQAFVYIVLFVNTPYRVLFDIFVIFNNNVILS